MKDYGFEKMSIDELKNRAKNLLRTIEINSGYSRMSIAGCMYNDWADDARDEIHALENYADANGIQLY